MGNIITPVLPHDLPENWNDTQYVSPGGTEVGLTEKHGYNYLMKQVNNSQKAINELDAEMKDIDTTLRNKAPIGYVQGVYDLRNYDSLDALLNVEYGNTPDYSAKVILIADNAGTTWGGSDYFAVIQRSDAHYGVVDFVSYNFNGTALRKALFNGVWLPLEWDNPPMELGKEYRTTERYLGNPVYKKMDSNGVIWWSTDQSTWKRESERVGSYSKTETDTLLQNKLTNPGWWHPIYVAKTGSDTTGDGSESKPYLTIQHALDVAPRTPACLRIYIGSGTYDEIVRISDFASIEIASKDANNPINVKAIEINRCAICQLISFNVIGVTDETYRGSVAAFNSSVVLHKITCTGNDLSESPYGGGFRLQDCHAKITDCTISNKFIAISTVSSTVYLDDGTTGTGNTTALRSGDGYGHLPSIIMKGNSSISGAEVTQYGGKIW